MATVFGRKVGGVCRLATIIVLFLTAGVELFALSGCTAMERKDLVREATTVAADRVEAISKMLLNEVAAKVRWRGLQTRDQIDRQTETLEQRMARLESASQEAVKPVREVQQWTVGGMLAIVVGVLWRAVKARGMLAMLQDIQEGLKGINMRG